MRFDVHDFWDDIWRDKKGRIVIWQTPNPFLIAWAAFTFLSLLFNGTTADVFSWLGIVALIVWSALEITKGINYFRRVLGLVVLVFAVLSIINLVK